MQRFQHFIVELQIMLAAKTGSGPFPDSAVRFLPALRLLQILLPRNLDLVLPERFYERVVDRLDKVEQRIRRWFLTDHDSIPFILWRSFFAVARTASREASLPQLRNSVVQLIGGFRQLKQIVAEEALAAFPGTPSSL